jgi:hypothetical protein
MADTSGIQAFTLLVSRASRENSVANAGFIGLAGGRMQLPAMVG